MPKHNSRTTDEVRQWRKHILGRFEPRDKSERLAGLDRRRCERCLYIELAPTEKPAAQLDAVFEGFGRVCTARSGPSVGLSPLSWLIALPSGEALCAFSVARFPSRVGETQEELDRLAEEGVALLREFAAETGRLSAQIDEEGSTLVLADGRRVLLAECVCRRLWSAEDWGEAKKLKPRRQLPPDDAIARLATPLARKLLQADRDGLEVLHIYAFPSDDDRPAHEDALHDRLVKDFRSAFKAVQAELSNAFGEPTRTGTKGGKAIPVGGVFLFACWNVKGRRLWAAAQHDDREWPYLLLLGTAATDASGARGN